MVKSNTSLIEHRHKTITLYLRVQGLLTRAVAQARRLDEDKTPIAVSEGKQIRDLSPLAQAQGVHLGQTVLRARRLCPLLLIVPLEQVEAHSLTHSLYDAIADLSPIVEPIGPDALFATLEKGEEALVLKALSTVFPGLTPILGIGTSKLAARACATSGIDTMALAQASVEHLWTADPAITGKLLRLGLVTFGDVVQVGEEALRYQFGRKMGAILYRRAHGIDDDPVQPLWPLPTVNIVRRFDLDPIADRACLDMQLSQLATQAAGELTALRRFGRVVTLQIETERSKTDQMRRSKTEYTCPSLVASCPSLVASCPSLVASWRPPWPIQSRAEVIGAARRLLALQPPGGPVTALHLTIAELELPRAESLSLFDSVGTESRRRLAAAKRLVVARYGSKALTTLGKVPVSLRDRRRTLAQEAINP